MVKRTRKIIMDDHTHADNATLFKLSSVKLKNFRFYEDLSLTLHPQLTVLVADNGGGKTTVLDAIRIGLWPYLSGFDLANKTPSFGNSIQIEDVRLVSAENSQQMARQLPVEITLTGVVNDQTLSWIRSRESEISKSQTRSDAVTRQLKRLAEQQQFRIRDLQKEVIDLPVFGYYGTGRLWDKKKLTSGKSSKVDIVDARIRTFAYTDCLDPASSYKQFESWFTDAFQVIWQEQIKLLKSGHSDIKASPEAENPVTVIQQAVNQLLSETGWQNPEYDQEEKTLVLSHAKHGVMPIDQLSDGIKNMLAMVADIAYRCALLNSHLGADAAQKSQGIVMIDEVDMHLHPKWQQTALNSLLEAFPNIQFIVTTHSPQVLSTIPAECIRILENNSVRTPLLQTKGVASADVLAGIQNVDPVPDVEQAGWLSNYKALIQQFLATSDEALQLREKLDAHFGTTHPVMLECDRLIRLMEMKKRLPKKKAG